MTKPTHSKGNFLSEEDLNSVKILSDIRQCVYLMESLTEKGLFRFGAIGGVNGRANNAIRRLGQCFKVENCEIKSNWCYVAMLRYISPKSPATIRDHEKKVRDYLFDDSRIYNDLRIKKKRKTDGIKITVAGRKLIDARKQLIHAFKTAL